MAVLQVPPLDLVYPTLGVQVCDFIEDRLVFGPGSLAGLPAKLDDEKRALIYRLYELQPPGHHLAGRRRFTRCGVELRKGTAKSELAAWIAACELHPEAPVRFDGWDADGYPVGRPVASPVIPMMAVTEEQVEELAYGVLRFILENSDDADLFDISKERIVRLGPQGGEDGFAVAVSNAPGARDGARTTFQHFDEPHRLFLPRQRDAHETMLQNLPKRPMEDPWVLYTSTAGQPGQGSIEEDVRAEAEAIDKGEVDEPSLFFFARWAGDEHSDLSTVEARMKAIADATGPMGEWGQGQFERIARDYDRRGIDHSYWERVWLNRWRRSGSQAFDMPRVRELLTDEPIEDGAFITAGFDGARFRDATALVITEIYTGKQQLMGLWERPEYVDEWEVPEDEVTDVVAEMFSRYEVWALYADPPHWTETIASWAGELPSQVIEWHTVRKRAMATACRIYSEAIESGIVTFPESHLRPDLLRHMGNAGRRQLSLTDDEGNQMWVMMKADGRLQDKFDAAMAGCLAWQATVDARRAGAQPKPRTWMPRRIR